MAALLNGIHTNSWVNADFLVRFRSCETTRINADLLEKVQKTYTLAQYHLKIIKLLGFESVSFYYFKHEGTADNLQLQVATVALNI